MSSASRVGHRPGDGYEELHRKWFAILAEINFLTWRILTRVTERGHWDTSKALVRRTLEKCIHLGRQHRAQGQKQDEYEAYRLLGQAVSNIV